MKSKDRFLGELSFLPWVLAGILPLLLIPFRRTRRLNILIFPQSKIGDFVIQTPLFREIKRSRPDARITVVITNPALEDLLRCDPHVDEIVVWNEKAGRLKKLKLLYRLTRGHYTWSINLAFQSWIDFITVYALVPHRVTFVMEHTEVLLKFFYVLSCTRRVRFPRRGLAAHVYLSLLEGMGITSDAAETRLYACAEHEIFIRDFMREANFNKENPLIGLAVSCGTKLKQMPIEKIAQLSDLLIARYKAAVVFIGSADDKEIVSAAQAKMQHRGIDSAGSFTLGQLAAFCKRLDLFISVDSGPLYIALAVGTPVIDITGPADITQHIKPSDKVKAVYPRVSCAPCSFIGSPVVKVCRLGHRNCLEQIDVHSILEAAEEILPAR